MPLNCPVMGVRLMAENRTVATEFERWFKGRLWSIWLAASWLVVGFIPWWLVMSWVVMPLLDTTRAMLPSGVYWLLALLVAAAALVPLYLFFQWVGSPAYKQETARAFGWWRRNERMAGMGKGGSARFGDLLDEWEHQHGPGAVLLGRSLFDKSPIGITDDRHLVLCASSRSGKGRAAIIPVLLTWGGSAIVIDPKGTNAAVTAARRGRGGGRVASGMGQAVHVVDPFGIVAGVTPAGFNPLAYVDVSSVTAKEDIGLITDALVVPGSGDSAHWDESARTILGGILAHILSRPSRFPSPSLLDLRAVFKLDADGLADFFADMAENDAVGGMAKAAAALVLNAGPNERGSFMTTVMRNTAWLDSVAMRDTLKRNDVDLSAVKYRATTVYIVLPPHLLDEHSRFMRLFVNLTVRTTAQGGKGKVPVLLIMDEFYSLGTLQSLAVAAGLLAGAGLRLMIVLQNLTQLRELYPRNWQTFFANAGAVQVFGVNDRETAEEIINRMGRVRWSETIDGRTQHVITNLIEAPELEQTTDRGTGLEFVLIAGKPPLLLRKMPYDLDPLFSREMYNPDPDHADS